MNYVGRTLIFLSKASYIFTRMALCHRCPPREYETSFGQLVCHQQLPFGTFFYHICSKVNIDKSLKRFGGKRHYPHFGDPIA